MKGFYFSLDAVLASSILLAMVTMLVTYPASQAPQNQDHRLDLIHTAALQPVEKWNSSFNTSDTVLEYIKRKYYGGDYSTAVEFCRDYFVVEEEYAVYLVNNSHETKICGSYNLSARDNIISRQSITPAIYVNNTVIPPNSALMVIND